MEAENIEWLYIDREEILKTMPKGFYAVLYCWDPHEGIFDGCISFNGVTLPDLPIGAVSSRPFNSITEANEWAEKNNPDN